MANRRRNSRGQFVGRGGSSRRRPARRGRIGMGSVYAIKRSGMGALSATVLLVSGTFYFRRMERFFADVA